MAKLIDLTGATVTVPSGWVSTPGYGNFDIFLWQDSNHMDFGNGLNIGYMWGGSDFPRLVSTTDSLCFGIGEGLYDSSDSLYFEIIDGTDVSNTNLIQWFIDNNATIEGGVWEEEKTPILIKNPIILIGSKAKKVVVDNVNMTIDVWTKEVPSGMQLSVTINRNWLDGVNDVILCFNIPSGIELNTSSFQDIFNIVGDKWYDTTSSNYLFWHYTSYTDEYYLNVYYSVNNTEYGVGSTSFVDSINIHPTTTLTKLDYYCPYGGGGSV